MLVEFTVSPHGQGESLSEHVAKVIDVVDSCGLPCMTHPMGTIVEGTWDEVMDVIKKCHHVLADQGIRTVTAIKIDDRPGKPMNRLTEKIKSVEAKLGRSIKK